MTDLKPGLIGQDTAQRLAAIAGQVPADQAIVEVGVFLARTTAFLAIGARDGNGAHIYGVDPWDLPGHRYPYQWLNDPKRGRIRQMFTLPSTREKAEKHVAQFDNVTLIRGFSQTVGEAWDGPPIGLLFIDGDHRAEHIRADWAAWRPHLTAEAVVAWDDYHPGWPDVPLVVDELAEQGLITITEIIERPGGGLALTRVNT